MNILNIYNKYHLPENLQMHMLRVAACNSLIIDNWNGPYHVINKQLFEFVYYMIWEIWLKCQKIFQKMRNL